LCTEGENEDRTIVPTFAFELESPIFPPSNSSMRIVKTSTNAMPGHWTRFDYYKAQLLFLLVTLFQGPPMPKPQENAENGVTPSKHRSRSFPRAFLFHKRRSVVLYNAAQEKESRNSHHHTTFSWPPQLW
jgi:hypothetical protein